MLYVYVGYGSASETGEGIEQFTAITNEENPKTGLRALLALLVESLES